MIAAMRRIVLALLLLVHLVPVHAADAPERPRIALVLSGGGARGFAHIGVLKTLKEMHVPVDMVVGVSMGAVIGGAYASGRTPEELAEFVKRTDWPTIVADRPPRDDLAFRRREEDLLVPSRIEFGIDKNGATLPPGAAGNVALEAALTRLFPIGAGDLPVDKLALPFRSVASDLLTGELVELRDTPLFMSVRASLAVPGVFTPVRVNNRLVVDGGLVRNLPVDFAREMGAQVIIAVNVGTPLSGESELTSAFGVAQQMLNILTEQNVQRSLRELGPNDILISPDLTGVGFLNFTQNQHAIAAGEKAAKALADQLKHYAVSPEEYAHFELNRSAAANAPGRELTIAKLEVKGTQHASPEALKEHVGLKEGDKATRMEIRRAAAALYGRGDFSRVDVDIKDRDDDQREVTIQPTEAGWAHSRVRLGLELSSDFADDNRFTFSAMHVVSWLNPWGAELRTLARIGSERSISTQWWQPIAPGSDWYVAPSLGYQASSTDLYINGLRSSRLGFAFWESSLELGRQLGNWGNVAVGLTRRVGSGRELISPSGNPLSGHFANTTKFVQFDIDTLDTLAFPTRGMLVTARLEQAAGVQNSARSALIGLQAFRAGEWAGHLYGEWSRSRQGTAPTSLGGFLQLSGTPRGSIEGQTVAFGRVVLAKRIGELPIAVGGPVRAGFSLELGGGFDDGQSVRLRDLKQAGSLFLSVDTRFGPLSFGAGSTRGIGGTLYLFLGPFW
jgi:NTE family protein